MYRGSEYNCEIIIGGLFYCGKFLNTSPPFKKEYYGKSRLVTIGAQRGTRNIAGNKGGGYKKKKKIKVGSFNFYNYKTEGVNRINP